MMAITYDDAGPMRSHYDGVTTKTYPHPANRGIQNQFMNDLITVLFVVVVIFPTALLLTSLLGLPTVLIGSAVIAIIAIAALNIDKCNKLKTLN